MAENEKSLVDLFSSQPVVVPNMPTESRRQQISGDELIAKAEQKTTKLNPAEERFLKSTQSIRTKASTDEVFAAEVMPKLKELKGQEKIDYINNKADDLATEELKQLKPELFSHSGAALKSFLDSAAFGQLSRIEAGLEALTTDGKSYGELAKNSAEELRLLQRAFPKSAIAGEVLSFMIPGSPVKKVFETALRGGAKLGKSAAIATKVIPAAAPGIRTKIFRRALEQGIATGLAGSAIEGIKGTLGSGEESPDVVRGFQDAIHAFPETALFGAAVPIAGAGVKAIANKGAQAVSELSNVSLNALRAPKKEIKRAVLRKADRDAHMLQILEDSKSGLDEVAQAEALLAEMPTVDVSDVVKRLRRPNLGQELTPSQKAQLQGSQGLEAWADFFEKTVGDVKNARPEKVAEAISKIGSEARKKFGNPEADFLSKQLTQAYGRSRVVLRQMASKSGETGNLYLNLMDKAADKRRTLSYLTKHLGNTHEVQQARLEGFYRSMLGQSKPLHLKKMQQLDELYGTDFVRNAQLVNYGNEFAGSGIVPKQTTGRSALGTVAGYAVGETLKKIPGAETVSKVGGYLASTPGGGRIIVGASDKLGRLADAIAAKPEILARIKSSRNPIVVREMADDLLQTLKKDGPRSMSSTLKILSSSAYFLGLVSAFEKAERPQNQQQVRADAIRNK